MTNDELLTRLERYFREGLEALYNHRGEKTVYTRLRWLRKEFENDTGLTIHETIEVLERDCD